MTSKVEICNLALLEAKYDTTIMSLEERSVAAERCNRIYDVCRRELLCEFPWDFATKFEHLARIDGSTVKGGSFAYSYPKEALRIVNIFRDESDYKGKNDRIKEKDNSRVVYFNGEKAIVCNYEEPFAEYIIDEQIEENFPPLFVRLLYLKIALRLAKLSSASEDFLKFIYAQIESEAEKAKVQSIGEDDNHICIDDEYYIKVR